MSDTASPTATRQLGRTDVRLPALGMGCAPLGELNRTFTEDEADSILETAWNGGIRYYDTSPWYGRGISELRLGRLLRQKPRDSFILSTKVGRTMHSPPAGYQPGFWLGGLGFKEEFDYSYDGLMRSYEQSQMRLGIPRIDMLLIHDLDVAEIGSEAEVARHFETLEASGWKAMEELRRSGDIAAIGAGVNIMGTIPAMLDRFDMDFFLVAMPYTLAAQSPLEGEFQRCQDEGVGVIIGSPYASGILVTGTKVAEPRFNYVPADQEMIAHVAQIERICRAHDVPLAAAALQFPLRQRYVASVIPGAEAPTHITCNIANAEFPIPLAFWDDLKASGLCHPEAL